MKLQTIACAVALATGGLFFTHVVDEARAATTNTESTIQSVQPTQAQKLVTRQLATLVDRQHYLNMRLDANTSNRILDMYLDSLDPDHTIFLASEVAAYKQKYGAGLGAALKAGDLTAPYTIHAQYRQHLKEFYGYMLAELKKPQNLEQKNSYIDTDREKAPYFKSSKEQHDYWHKMLVSQLINLTISKQEDLAKQKVIKADPALAQGEDLSSEDLTPEQTLTKRYTRQLERVGRIKSDDVLDKILNSMTLTYDPHSNYFPPVDAMELNRQTTLQLEGIGVSIRPERGNEDYTKIETIVDGGPASKSGLIKPGDRIIGVSQDGEKKIVDVIGWSSQEIVGLIRGKRGTKVTLKLLGAGAPMSQARTITLVRDVIKEDDQGVQSRVVKINRDGKQHTFGVIEIPSFYLNYRARREGADYRSVSKDTNDALKALSAQKVEGIIIDLRNNPGGSLEEVSRMIGQVIKSGPVVQIRDSNGNVNVFEDNDGGQQTYAGPLAVLVNLASASASEIYSAAIQDYGRGIIIGSTTTGKGTAQVQLDSLAYGQATLTQRKFYRITGGSTQNKGVIPDIKLVDIWNDEFGERKAKNALKWDTIPTAPFKREGVIKPYLPTLEELSAQRVEHDPQFTYLETRRVLAKKTDDEKRLVLDLDQRKAELDALEKQTLDAENLRRKETGLPPYADWSGYQASLDALSESRAKMKANVRPPLPEEEAFVTEAANVLLDYAKLQRKAAN